MAKLERLATLQKNIQNTPYSDAIPGKFHNEAYPTLLRTNLRLRLFETIGANKDYAQFQDLYLKYYDLFTHEHDHRAAIKMGISIYPNFAAERALKIYEMDVAAGEKFKNEGVIITTHKQVKNKVLIIKRKAGTGWLRRQERKMAREAIDRLDDCSAPSFSLFVNADNNPQF